MKNNKIIYVLVPAVIIIWSLIVIRVNDSILPEEENIYYQAGKQEFSLDKILKEDTLSYALNLNYRDPFLAAQKSNKKRRIVAQVTNQTTQPLRHTKKAEEQPEGPGKQPLLSNIRLVGVVKSKNNNKEVALIEFQGITRMLAKGDSLGGCILVKIAEDSALFQQGNRKVYVKQ